MEPVNGFVLAGGKSTRMGQDKGLFRLGNRPFVQIAADLLATQCRRVFLLAPENRYHFLGLPAIPDRFDGGGPLVAIASGLQQSDAELNLFLPCDMPFLTVDVLVRIISMAQGVDAVVPSDEKGRWSPLSAAYRRRCLPTIEDQLAKGNFKVDGFFPNVTVGALPIADYPERTFVNINSPIELTRWVRED